MKEKKRVAISVEKVQKMADMIGKRDFSFTCSGYVRTELKAVEFKSILDHFERQKEQQGVDDEHVQLFDEYEFGFLINQKTGEPMLPPTDISGFIINDMCSLTLERTLRFIDRFDERGWWLISVYSESETAEVWTR